MEKILVYITIIIIVCESQVWALDHCDGKFCNGSRLHTLCKYQVKIPATNCVQYERTVLNDEDKNAILDKLNKRRAMIAAGEVKSFPSAANMRKLIWNDELSLSAQRWADQCVKHDVPDVQDECRDLENVAVGQNIATVVGESPGLTPASLVDVWYMQLLDINPNIISTYERPPATIQTHQDYFTQLVWAETYQVGCGAVKFRETYDDSGMEKTRAIHRVVCNFAPRGNILGDAVYEDGVPCSKCPDHYICDENSTALCYMHNRDAKETYLNNRKKSHPYASGPLSTELNDLMQDAIDYGSYPHLFQLSSLWTTSTEKISRQDFLSKLLDITKKTASKTTDEKPCKNVLAVDDLLTLLKKKLKDDFAYDMSTTKMTPEDRFGDVQVEDFISKLYKDKFTSPTQRVSEMENLNSTLLVNLVEAVIFRNTGKYTPSGSASTTEGAVPYIDTVKIKQIQAELAPTTASNQFDGHYFFPEDEEEGDEEGGEGAITDDNNTNESTESYYDGNLNLSPSDVLAEIEDLKRKSEARDFLDDILDAEDITESVKVTTTTQLISPDDMALFKDGYNNMKRFLDEIGEKKIATLLVKKFE